MENSNPSSVSQTQSQTSQSPTYLWIIHPSQDFSLKFGCYTIPLLVPDVGNKAHPLSTKYLIVLSDGRSHYADDVETLYEKANIMLKTRPQGLLTDRWKLKDIERFCKNPFTCNAYELFSRCVAVFDKYCDLKEVGWYHFVALWIMATYVFRVFETFPYVGITGFKGSGKSKTADLIARLAFNGISTVGISESSLFRIVEAVGATIIVDEGEQLKDKHKAETIRQLLNAGYRKGALVFRQEKNRRENFETKSFDPFSPKIVVNIAGLEEALDSRSINITMLRSKSERGRKIVTDHSEDWDELHHNLYTFGLVHFQAIRVAYQFSSDVQIDNNRANDLWSPILAVAKVVFREHPEEFEAIKAFAAQQIEANKDEANLDSQTHALILALKQIVAKTDWFSNKDILNAMKDFVEEDFELKSSAVGFRMKRLGLNEKHRAGRGISYRIKPEDVQEIMDRFDVDPNPENPSLPSSPSLPA